jgi:hypothetical protein
MRRAAISIPSNIAEGRKRGGESEFRQFLRIAFGSAAELETQVELSERLGFTNSTATKHLKDILNESHVHAQCHDFPLARLPSNVYRLLFTVFPYLSTTL